MEEAVGAHRRPFSVTVPGDGTPDRSSTCRLQPVAFQLPETTAMKTKFYVLLAASVLALSACTKPARSSFAPEA